MNADTVVVSDTGGGGGEEGGGQDTQYHKDELLSMLETTTQEYYSNRRIGNLNEEEDSVHEENTGIVVGPVEPMEVEEGEGWDATDTSHSPSAEERRAEAYLMSSASGSESQTQDKALVSEDAATTVTNTIDNIDVGSPEGPLPEDAPQTDSCDIRNQNSSSAESLTPTSITTTSVPPSSSSSSSSNNFSSTIDISGSQPQGSQLTVSGTEGHLHVHLDNNPAFNTFNYWRTPIMPVELPIPKIEVDIDIVGQTTNVCVKAKVQENDDTYQSQVNLTMAASPSITLSSPAQDKLKAGINTTTTIEVSQELG